MGLAGWELYTHGQLGRLRFGSGRVGIKVPNAKRDQGAG